MKKTTLGKIMPVIAGSMLAALISPASAVDFKGKTIEWIIPFGLGGGSDVLARFTAPYLSKYLPGNPTIVLVNVPGGGSTTGANRFAANAKPDGLTMLITSGSTQFPYLLGDKRVKYEYKDFKVVMAGPTGGVAYVSSKFGVKTVKDLAKLKGQRLVYGSQGATSLDLVPMLGFRMLGLDVHHVFGMKGRGLGRLAFERGEATIDYQTSSAYVKNSLPLVKAGTAAPLFSWGTTNEAGDLVRDPAFPDLPHIAEAYEIVHGKKPSGPDWEAFRAFLIAGFPAQKLVLLQKDTPDDIVQAYRDAATKMFADADYKAKSDAALGGYPLVTGKAAEALVKLGTTITPQARALVRDYLTKTHNVKF